MTTLLRRMVRTTALTAILSLGVAPAPALAATVITPVNVTYTATNPYTFTYGDSSFTFTGTGDIFNPTAISTGGTGQVNTIFGSPTTNFVDRGTVTFGSGDQYAPIPSPTPIRFSNGNNFIGLLATSGGNTFYGYAFTTNNTLNSYAFNNTPSATITATTSVPAVPEPATWLMMLTGFGVVGATMRMRRRQGALATA